MYLDHPLLPTRSLEGFERAAVSLLRAERFLAECAGTENEDAAWSLYKLACSQFLADNPTAHDQDIAWTWAREFEAFVQDFDPREVHVCWICEHVGPEIPKHTCA